MSTQKHKVFPQKKRMQSMPKKRTIKFR